MIELEEIVHTWQRRRLARSDAINRAEEICDTYNGDMPLERLAETMAKRRQRLYVPNLVAQGLDQMAMRIASGMMNVDCPPVRPGIGVHEKRARRRRQAIFGLWEDNKLDLMDRRRARWLVGYGAGPVYLRPSVKNRSAVWVARSPLGTFPGETENPDDCEPPDCVFSFTRTFDWLRREHPDAYARIEKPANHGGEDSLVLLEWCDAEETVLLVLSAQATTSGNGKGTGWSYGESVATARMRGVQWSGSDRYVQLSRYPNRTGLCGAVVPGRITLDRNQGAYDGIVGMLQTHALMVALEVEAVIDGIFPNEWLYTANQQGPPPDVTVMPDGRRGIIGKLSPGTDIKVVERNPGYLTNPTRDYLERSERLTAGIPAEFGGESATNVRTGRRGDSILSAVVDYPVQEAQTILARAREAENRRAIAILKAYFGNEKKSFYVTDPRAPGQADYVPNEVFDTDRNRVFYPFAGADTYSLTVGAGQLVGTGLASQRTMREMHPWIEDAEVEHDRLVVEGLERALMASIEQLAAAGQLPPDGIARLMMEVGSDRKELAEAYLDVQREFQERQAAPAEPGSPEAQPGLSPPGAGSEAGAAIPPVSDDLSNLASQLGALYRGGGAALQRGAA